jgi:hypothetical protein
MGAKMKNNYYIPCKIGDTVYVIVKYNGIPTVKRGEVSQMFFVGEEMRLAIVVKKIARGEWGKTIFPSREEALKVIEEGGK